MLLARQIIPAKAADDVIHIAAASVHEIDCCVPCWVKKGHLQVDHLEEGIVEYPRSLAL